MLRFPEDDARALRAMGPAPEAADMPGLERIANERIAALRSARVAEAARRGALAEAHARFDQALYTDEPEHLDERDFPADEKLRIVHALHGQNRATRAYWRFGRVLRPWIEGVARREGRRARLLELASGSGEFTLALGEEARRVGLPVEITGSDYVPEYVEAGREKARARDLDVRFEIIDAFDMSRVSPGAYDLVFIAQSVHHFSAGQLAMMIAQSRRIATSAFVAMDGRRSLMLLALLSTTSALTLRRSFFHDALTSARKLFPESELAEIARLAAPGAHVEVRPDHPGYSVLTASWR